MRVLLNRHRRTEQGAIAIIVAVLMLGLCTMAAIVLDFGLAYNNKTQAQSAADAGALAAGKVYADAKAKCDPKLETVVGGVFADAYEVAENVRKASMPGSDPGVLKVTCDKTDSTVKVAYDVPAKSPIGLGSFIVGDDHMDLSRHAAVKWAVSQKAVGGLRPWMICGAQVPTGTIPDDHVVEIGLPGNGHKPAPATCGTDQPGDWWRTECLGAKGSNGETYNAVLNGCTSVSIVPGSAGLTDKADRAHVLLGACNTDYVGSLWKYPPKKGFHEETYCMHRDTGRDVKGLAPAWDTLIGQTIAMPVFCAEDNCTPSSTVTGDSKATWPVWKIAAVTICGYAMHGVYSPPLSTVGDDCNNYAYGADPHDFLKDDIGFLLIFRGLLDSGDVASFTVPLSTTVRLVE